MIHDVCGDKRAPFSSILKKLWANTKLKSLKTPLGRYRRDKADGKSRQNPPFFLSFVWFPLFSRPTGENQQFAPGSLHFAFQPARSWHVTPTVAARLELRSQLAGRLRARNAQPSKLGRCLPGHQIGHDPLRESRILRQCNNAVTDSW